MTYEPEIKTGRTTLHATLKRAAKNGPFEIVLPTNTISDSGKDEIHFFLSAALGVTLPHNWSWEWVRHRGTYTGTFPKRVAKYVKKHKGEKLSPGVLTHIGNIAKKHSETTNRHIVDFTQKIEWEAGDFGDNRSCFWGGSSNAKLMLQQNRAFAVRFWKTTSDLTRKELDSSPRDCQCDDYCTLRERETTAQLILRHDKCGKKMLGDEKLVGYGRAWMVTDLPERMSAILFNCYPKGFQLFNVARVLASWLDVSYKQIALRNKRSSILFINNGNGYVLGDRSRHIPRHWDLNWGRPVVGMCRSCHTVLLLGDERQFEGVFYCTTCMDKFLVVCSFCYHPFRKDTSTPVWHSFEFGGYHHEPSCPECTSRHSYECPLCERRVVQNETLTSMQYDDNGQRKGVMTVCYRCDNRGKQLRQSSNRAVKVTRTWLSRMDDSSSTPRRFPGLSEFVAGIDEND